MRLYMSVVVWSLLASISTGDKEITIYHINDVHSNFAAISADYRVCKPPHCYGGFGRIATVVREARKTLASKMMFVVAGDTFTGTDFYRKHKATVVTEFMNALAPDATSLGHHDFDDGPDVLNEFVKNHKHPVICCNVDASKEQGLASNLKNSIVLTLDGVKVGVIGYLTPETLEMSNVGLVQFKAISASLKEEADKLKKDGAQLIVAVGHAGYDQDLEIAKEVPQLDVIVGGRSNTFLYTGTAPEAEKHVGPYPTAVKSSHGKTVYVVTAFAYTKYIGKLVIKLNEENKIVEAKGNPIVLHKDIAQADDMLALVNKYNADLESLRDTGIGTSKMPLSSKFCRSNECGLGNLITDALISQKMMNYGEEYWTDTAIAVVNAGSIRGDLEAGKLTERNLLTIMPIQLTIYSFNLNGSDLMRMLETSIRSNGETDYSEFLQVSGLKVTYDLRKREGTRVVNVLARCADCYVPQYEQVDLDKPYRILASSFLLSGGDGYNFLELKAFNLKAEDLSDFLALSWYLEREQTVFTEINGRITVNKRSRAEKPEFSHFIIYPMLYTIFIFIKITCK